MLTFAATLGLYLTVFRSLARRFLSMFDWWTQPVAIIGSGKEASEACERLLKCVSEGLRPIGIIYDPNEHWNAAEETGASFLGPITELASILIENRTCRVAVTERKNLAWQQYHGFHGIPHVMLPTDLGHHPIEKARLAESNGNIQLHCRINLTNPVSLASKRAMDLILVIGSMVFWLPLCVLIAICIKFLDPGPVFYHQARVGRFRKPFTAIKFRSMVTDADQKLRDYLNVHPESRAEWEATHKLKNDPRVTKFGEFLRKTSLDELPQLFNVLRGQMSLVGPRPIIDCSNYDREYIQNHPEVFELYQMVRPGITGLWQVSGRNSLPYRQRVHLDRCYLHNWSVTLDIFILWKTIKTAIFREGAF
jgi:Undecaprenyl-phosphate galactose phosphotransferase WbaP